MGNVVEAKGYCSRVRFDGDSLIFEFNGMHKSTLGMDSAVIPIESIVDVTMKKSTWMTNGVLCVQVMLPDGQVSEAIDNPALAMDSPYCASIMRTRQSEFDALVAAVGAALPAAPVPAAQNLFLLTKSARKQTSGIVSARGASVQSEVGNVTAPVRNIPAGTPDFATHGQKVAKFKGDDGTTFHLYEHAIRCGLEEYPLTGVVSTVEDGSALQERLTATRIFLAGPFAWAFKKRKGGEKWLSIVGPDFAWIAKADMKHISDAMKFSAQVNNQARRQ